MNKIYKIIFTKLIIFVSVLVASCLPGGDITSNLTLFAGQIKATTNGTLDQARFSTPLGITIDDTNNLYVTEPTNHIIRKISSTGIVTTYAGKAQTIGAINGTLQDATFNTPSALVFDKSRKFLYVADFGNSLIRRIDATGTVSTLTGQLGIKGFKNGDSNEAHLSFNPSTPLVIDSKGNLYFPDDSEYVIRKITPTGQVSTYAGVQGVTGNLDGQINLATFSAIKQMVIDSNDNILITTENSLRKISTTGIVTTVFSASTELEKYFFASPSTLTIDSNNNLYAYGAINQNKVGMLKMSPDGQITPYFQIDIINGAPHDSSNLTIGIFLTSDTVGNVFLADVNNSVIRKFQPNGVMRNIGQPILGSLNSNDGLKASFAIPNDFTTDQNGNIFITDSSNNMLRKVTPFGQVTKFSGGSGPSDQGLVNGDQNTSRFFELSSIVYNSEQNIFYVVDQLNKVIRTILPDGSTMNFTGRTSNSFQDGYGVDAGFHNISAVTINPSNTFLHIVDGNKIRKIDTNGLVSTIYNPENNLLQRGIDRIVSDSSGNAFVVSENTLYKISASGSISIVYKQTFSESINLLGLIPTPLSLKSVETIDNKGNLFLQYCAKYDLVAECEIRKLNVKTNILTSTGVKANALIRAFKFDKNGQAFAIVDNALFKAKID